MTKELVAQLAVIAGLITTVFGFGIRIGTLSERVEALRVQNALLVEEVKAINAHFIAYAMRRDEADR